jgi:hypothetical protein
MSVSNTAPANDAATPAPASPPEVITLVELV